MRSRGPSTIGGGFLVVTGVDVIVGWVFVWGEVGAAHWGGGGGGIEWVCTSLGVLGLFVGCLRVPRLCICYIL